MRPIIAAGLAATITGAIILLAGAVRRMLITPDALGAVAAGAPPPDGTRILMETDYQPDRHAVKRRGEERGTPPPFFLVAADQDRPAARLD